MEKKPETCLDRGATSRQPFVQLVIVLLIAYLLLFLGMPRRPGMYDEGIVLTGAMRVLAGQIPHRDFYFIYGPAEVYILAGLFKIFGPSLLAERLFDLLIKALVVTTVYAIALSYCRRSIALFVSVVTGLWLFGLNEYGLAVTPVSLLNLIGSILILPAFAGRVSKRRMLAAGAVSGMAFLFRYDTGVALIGIHACVLAIAVCLRTMGLSNRLRAFATLFWPYLVGVAVLTVVPALYYLSVAPLAPLLHDVIFFPRRYYFRGRNLPFPGISWRELENLGIYLPLAIAALSLYAVLDRRSRTAGTGAASVEGPSREPEWQGFLVTFGLLLVVMYLKGVVRVAPIQMYLAIVPSLLVIAVLFQHQSAFSRPIGLSIGCLMWLSLIAATWSALHLIRLEYLTPYSVAQRILPFARRTTPDTPAEWCKTASPLTAGLCFLPEDDRIRAIEYIRGHTLPGQSLYSGLRKHDRIVANDNLIYFATQRLPATRWSHFDPDLQNRYEIQMQMVHELQQNAPPYIALDSEFDAVREPNDSSTSSGVMLLDDYIQKEYQPNETFGTMTVWRRRIHELPVSTTPGTAP
jgi:Dolichyl-phosphate-mannose-protein mannosyltransferase